MKTIRYQIEDYFLYKNDRREEFADDVGGVNIFEQISWHITSHFEQIQRYKLCERL